VRLRDRLGVGERRQRQLTWLMEVVMFCVLLLGLWKRNVPIIVNAGVALAIAQIVPFLERDYGIPASSGMRGSHSGSRALSSSTRSGPSVSRAEAVFTAPSGGGIT
jgi:hypothetical protein